MGKLLALMLVLVSCNALAIRNGSKINHSDQPNLVKLTKNGTTCSGIRISKNYILTAAHCFHNSSRGSFKVRYMEGKVTITKTLSVSAVIIKGSNLSEELAIIPIKSDNEEISFPEIYPYAKDSFNTNSIFQIYGFGMTQNGSLGKLRQGEVKFKNHHIDAGRYTYPLMLTKAAKKNQMVCPGDSGGPIFKKDDLGVKSLVGIVSFISGESRGFSGLTQEEQCQKGSLAAYIPLSEHTEFLARYID